MGLWKAAVVSLLLLSLQAPHAAAQNARYPGNLDVPYVPTNQPAVEAMLRIAGVGPSDYLIDLGSGDGRILITAAKKHGARGFGVDLDPRRVAEGIANAREAGVSSSVQFYQRNLFDTKIVDATVVSLYLLPRVNLELRPRLLAELKPGTRVVSHDFDMGDWKPDLQASVRGASSVIYFWVIPAQVAGEWKVRLAAPAGSLEYELEITQKYQEISVMGSRAGKAVTVISPRLDGDVIRFTLVDHDDAVYRKRFEGKVNGRTIQGSARGEANVSSGEFKWQATRVAQ